MRFKKLDEENRGFITTEELREALGGKELVEQDKRMKTLLWQVDTIMDGKIGFEDFKFMLTYASSVI
jgi:Ca2+-binding EF-hand superfamily protein